MAREGLDILVIEKTPLGGQVGITQTLDNFPGFHKGISGSEFAERLVMQARRFDVKIMDAQEVGELNGDRIYGEVTTADGRYYCIKAALLATGPRYRRLRIPGEDELIRVNVHFCATCDGAFYKDKKCPLLEVATVDLRRDCFSPNLHRK